MFPNEREVCNVTPVPNVRAESTRPRTRRRDDDVTRLVDGTLEDSFPASDPPSWTASVATPGARRAKRGFQQEHQS